MAADDIGAELWALVYHLFHKYRRDPRKAAQELALRTHTEWAAAPNAPPPQTARGVVHSRWYEELRQRYAALLASLRATHQRDIADATEMVSSLYPEGCNVSEYAEALRTSAAVLPCLVPSAMIDHLVHKRGGELHAQGVHELSCNELVFDVIEGLLMRVLTPRQWWCQAAPSIARATRTGIRAAPPTLYIEYERPPGVPRVRRIDLGAVLRPNTPTAQLARRLAATHEALLSESQFQTLLIRCQRLQEQSPLSPPAPAPLPNSAPVPTTTTRALPPPLESSPGPAPIARVGKAQKADLGLLYRDPDAALANVDLNDADEVTLQEFKDVMNEKFKANVVKPGDAGYVYDKRVEVTRPAQSSEWDDDDSD
ncbi:CEP19-like protein [Novymonas esmeraldas]|uniref:Centrosomal protein of 19 kDa n=1 Tax=Novymonas esmeraldas TaxID=1808958 RepID=A0AAW0ESY3_9TRYP